MASHVNPPEKPPRSYDSPARRASALETERRILEAAAALFAERGYVGTSLAAIARRAGVNPRTLYKVFDSKVTLLSRFVDVSMVGDDSDVAVVERSWATHAFEAPTGRQRIAAFAAMIRRVMESAGPAFRTAAQAAASDDDAAALWRIGQSHRYDDVEKFVVALERSGFLRADLTREEAISTVWLVASPETYLQLTDGRGLTLDDFQIWIERTLRDTLLREAE